MKKYILILIMLMRHAWAQAEVRVFIQDIQGLATIKYECTSGEVVRAFALDIAADRGQIVGITNYFRGECRDGSTGYGIFPAAFRDLLAVSNGTNVNWEASGYTPLANVADQPDDTLPGLNSYGVTLEFAGLWDPTVPASIPAPTGTLCSLYLSEAAQVSIKPNVSRGGVIPASPDTPIDTAFARAWVDPAIMITGCLLLDGVLNIRFQGGELETASTIEGPWIGTGNTSGLFLDKPSENQCRFYRVYRH
jgi:hypothetical protein